ncbi:Acyl-coenzyme A thioesterase THEM4 [Varanus komodoensis]|uniref:Acyl-coenzyme A thioesterase THEM4 n=1 Tax=Varanus komodoensis TaxID=61221 RepID=A0A8D2KV82_VARKO|nr:acyl-coenzyme A thioesterase THEM4-like [Varanus komodoensis]XP_044305114.1 acyl-coenzyme A thioesterase THEM4-like [Varanus komodoensis]XP_044305116.1 acyl-coenzyme A thioesterase THEM4-like [Varanus komodoensis]KAF7238326.1 Acyl-coenzyme A thioesterase THEM4 [Varanus komodoensis]
MLRSFLRAMKGLACQRTPRAPSQAALASEGTLQRASHALVCNATIPLTQPEKTKDYALPNPGWSQEMLDQFNRLMEMTEDGTWRKLPSYRHALEHIPGETRHWKQLKDISIRNFLRNTDVEGAGFEYAMFLNLSEERLLCVFQPGPYLGGPPGFTHGGSIASILDASLGTTANCIAGRAMTAHLSINYKSPLPLGSVVLVKSRLDRMEGRKLFTSGQVESLDGQTLYAEASGLFIKVQDKKPSSNEQGPSTQAETSSSPEAS